MQTGIREGTGWGLFQAWASGYYTTLVLGGVGEGSGSMGGPVLQASRDSSNPQREDKEG